MAKRGMREKGKVSVNIGKRSSLVGEGPVVIEINDEVNFNRIAEISFTLEQFGELMSTAGYISGEIELCDVFETLNVPTETKKVCVNQLWDRFKGLEKTEKRELIRKALTDAGELEKGWIVHSFGLDSQQPYPGKHEVVLYRYKRNT